MPTYPRRPDFDLAPRNLTTPVTNIKRLNDPVIDAAALHNDETVCNFGTDTQAEWILVRPQQTNSTRMGTAMPATLQNVGWRLDPADLGVDANSRRKIDAGTWQFAFNVRAAVAQITADTQVGVVVWAHRGGSTLRIAVQAGTATAVAITPTQANANFTLSDEVILAANDYIQVECFIKAPGIAVTGQTITVRLEAQTDTVGAGVRTKMTLPSPLRFYYPRSIADAAPATETPTRVYIAKRTRTESAPASDAVTRQFIGARAIVDAAPANDTLSRITVFDRRASDAAPASDSTERLYIATRTVIDAAPASDVVSRVQGRFARVVSDVAAAVDVASRVLQYARTIVERIGAGLVYIEGFDLELVEEHIELIVVEHAAELMQEPPADTAPHATVDSIEQEVLYVGDP